MFAALMSLLFSSIQIATVIVLLAAPVVGRCDGSRLAIGDIVAVTVDGEKDFTKQYQINRDGCITLPMNLKPVKIAGLNTSDAAAEISKRLNEVLVNPQVSVAFVERARMQVFVVGQVKKPGLAEIGVGDRVLQALAQAGYDDTSDLARVSIRRGDESIPIDLTRYLSGDDLNANVELQPGDTIVVPRVDTIGTVMVLGQVMKVGSVPITRDMRFRELMGLVGGVTVEADTEKITIRRQGVGQIAVDYKRAMDGDPTADLVLQPQDVIYVPQIETAFFTIMGGVNRPGQYPLKGKLTLSEAIGVAGGPAPEFGDLRKVRIVRAANQDNEKSETLDINLTELNEKGLPEPLIKRGDVITVAVRKQKTSFLDVLRTILPFGWIFR
jgi:polysaccharide export outer membrane protein